MRPLRGKETMTPPEEVSPLLPRKEEKSGLKKEIEIAAMMLVVIGLGSLNRVFSKIVTEPMDNYAFFITLFNGFAYVILYSVILAVRYAMGKVPKKALLFPFRAPPASLHSPWWCDGGSCWGFWDKMWGIKYFVFTGLLEGLSNIMTVVANPYISGIMGSLAGQSVLLFAMPSAILMLGTRYTIWQMLGAFVVLIGALVAIIPDLFTTYDHGPVSYILLMAMSNLPSAISFTIKELIFKKEKDVELFVVNTVGSIFQLIWWPLMIPLTLLFNQTDGLAKTTYIYYGFMCFFGHSPPDSHADCSPMPTPYFAYISANLLFNITLLMLLKKASALQSFMAIQAILPVGIFLFLIDWPLIGKSSLSMATIASLIVVLIGLVLYRWATYEKEKEAKATTSKTLNYHYHDIRVTSSEEK